MIKKMIKLILISLISFGVINSTRIGWILWSKSFNPVIAQKEKLSPLANELKNHVVTLSHNIGSRDIINNYENINKSAEYITKELSGYGYDVQFQNYPVYNRQVKNIFVIKKSPRPDAKTLIVGAHYDTFSNPGADDNTSAVAGVLALAKKFSKVKTNINIHFVLFANEEPPFFQTEAMGSMVYAKSLKQKNIAVKGAMVLEMIGCYSNKWFSQTYPVLIGPFFPNKGNFIAFVSNFESINFLRQIQGYFFKNSVFPSRSLAAPSIVNGVDFSDHWSFWQQGYPAIMVTDTAFLRNKNYHKQTDTYEKLDYTAMAEIINGLEKTISEIRS